MTRQNLSEKTSPEDGKLNLPRLQLLCPCLNSPLCRLCSLCIWGEPGTNWGEPDCWEGWRNDILKANTEDSQSEKVTAATDAGIMDDTGSKEQRGMSVQDERLLTEKTIHSRWKPRCPDSGKGLSFLSKKAGRQKSLVPNKHFCKRESWRCGMLLCQVQRDITATVMPRKMEPTSSCLEANYVCRLWKLKELASC